MNLHLVILIAYSLGMIALGLIIGRRVKGTSDFFVARRQLGPGLMFSTMLAANIGAGSTVGATSLGYSGGLAAFWWVGAAALGSLGLAFWIGPAMRREAAAHDLKTVGDYLEYRYSPAIRATVAVLLWIGSIFILAGQLVAIGSILETVAGLPSAFGCAIGGIVITAYFTAGGLLSSARVNVLQLAVKLGGFAVAVPLVITAVGGWSGFTRVRADDPAYWSFWRYGPPGLVYLVTLAPSFMISPGLLQKVFGARDDRAVRLGVGLNALGLLLYAAVPAILGIATRGRFPELRSVNDALPTVLIFLLPPVIGAIALAAVFSAEISASDAVLFMLTTSLAQDLYRRFINPKAADRRVLQVARTTAVAVAVLGVGLAITLGSVVDALRIFYTLLTVSFFVPILAGLYAPHATTLEAGTSIACGIVATVVTQFATAGRGIAGLTADVIGVAAALLGFAIVYLSRISFYGSTRAL
ncbi:MAG TPA: sodium:solute symporter family protein [Vicinamibacterales bacterium]